MSCAVKGQILKLSNDQLPERLFLLAISLVILQPSHGMNSSQQERNVRSKHESSLCSSSASLFNPKAIRCCSTWQRLTQIDFHVSPTWRSSSLTSLWCMVLHGMHGGAPGCLKGLLPASHCSKQAHPARRVGVSNLSP